MPVSNDGALLRDGAGRELQGSRVPGVPESNFDCQ
jgi:hypothetical protein